MAAAVTKPVIKCSHIYSICNEVKVLKKLLSTLSLTSSAYS